MNVKKSIDELKELLGFLLTLYGVLADISVFFPYAGRFIYLVGMWPYGGFGRFPQEWVLLISTLTTVICMLYTFGQRYEYNFIEEGSLIRKEAWNIFLKGISALVIYIIATVAIIGNIYFIIFKIESGSLLWIFGDTFLLIVYSYSFATVTRACMLFGMTEFYHNK